MPLAGMLSMLLLGCATTRPLLPWLREVDYNSTTLKWDSGRSGPGLERREGDGWRTLYPKDGVSGYILLAGGRHVVVRRADSAIDLVAEDSAAPARLPCTPSPGTTVSPDRRRIVCITEGQGMANDEFRVVILAEDGAQLASRRVPRPPPAGAWEPVPAIDGSRLGMVGFLASQGVVLVGEVRKPVPYAIDKPILCRLFAVPLDGEPTLLASVEDDGQNYGICRMFAPFWRGRLPGSPEIEEGFRL